MNIREDVEKMVASPFDQLIFGHLLMYLWGEFSSPRIFLVGGKYEAWR